jgi:transcription antitermination factor NusG
MLGVQPIEQILGQATAADGDWFVLHTRSRQEKAVAADLQAMRIAFFLPLVKTVRYYGRRKVAVRLPLFPGYVFLRGSVDQAYEADRTGRLANVIRVQDQHTLDSQLIQIHRALDCGAELDPHPYLYEGLWVEVRSGPLKGIQGVIEQRTKNNRLILQIQALGQASSLEIDAALLDPIDQSRLCS